MVSQAQVNLKAWIQAIEVNPVSSIRRVSGKIDICSMGFDIYTTPTRAFEITELYFILLKYCKTLDSLQ